jgi:hypothetical protein
MSSSLLLELVKLAIDGSPIAILGFVAIRQAEILRKVVDRLSQRRRK